MRIECSKNIGQASTENATSESAESITSKESMSYAADSPVRIFPTPGEGQDLTENEVVYSSRPFAWFANYNRELLCWRTWQLCFLEDWTEYLGRWPRSGSMRNGIVYRLPPLVPRISGIDYLSSVSDKEIHRTPNASNGIDGGSNSRKAAKKREERFITPTADDTGHRKNKYSQGGQALSHQLGGTLNPQWVEWLMGFPIGWTDCEDSETQ